MKQVVRELEMEANDIEQVFDLDTKESVTIPPTSDFLTVTPRILARINAAYSLQIDNKVRFYRGDATGLYPNNDNQYVTTVIPLELLWRPYTVFLDDEKISFREYNNNGTHVWINLQPNTA